MRGRTIPRKFLGIGIAVLFCFLLTIITSGCKKETDEGSSEEQLHGRAFDLREIPDSEVAWPKPPLPLALKLPGKVRKAVIEIEGNEYGIFLNPHPRADICLFPKDRPLDYPRWEGAHLLKSMHVFNGAYYRFAINSAGDKLFIHPYEGRFGTFEVGAGGRDANEVTISGSLLSKNTAVAIGGELENGWPKPKQGCRVPEGDYALAYSTIILGRLQIDISSNLHTDDQGSRLPDRPRLYAIKISKEKPYIFDFSNKPDVVFALPAKNQQLKLGEKLQVKAVLIDPELDIMICRIADTTRKQKREYIDSDGQKHTIEYATPLDPKVIITRVDGEKVAEGVMPFG